MIRRAVRKTLQAHGWQQPRVGVVVTFPSKLLGLSMTIGWPDRAHVKLTGTFDAEHYVEPPSGSKFPSNYP